MKLIKTISHSVMALSLLVMLSMTVDGFSLIEGANAKANQAVQLTQKAKARERARKISQQKSERKRIKKQKKRQKLAKLQKQRKNDSAQGKRKQKSSAKTSKTKISKQVRKKDRKRAKKKVRKQQLAASKSRRKSSSASSVTTSKDINLVEIAPLRDLGTDRGRICFRVQAYSTTAQSDLSTPVCTEIKNNTPLKLVWSESSNAVIGYRVYFGDNERRSNNLLTDVAESATETATKVLNRLL